ncbi:Uncharacterised protein [Anaerococcus prevotii]|uniref:DUF5673 domain-containing protein n=2 Tax=Anaerococcus prevotii TaxID=33034 RepID=C7RG01_ANAPD|nr:hypothetical protein Apre_0363 [Anaerococcus prevotii DSM 20548]SUU93971.1 Uncharacterised protein [Anaerococcus prevotii]
MLIAFLIGSFYNFRLGYSNEIRIKIKATFLIIIGAYSILIFIMAGKKDGSLFGLILALSTIILLLSNILSQGVRKDGFVLMNGANPLLLLIKLSDVKDISLEEKKAGIKLTIKAHGTCFVEYFKKKDMKKLEEFIADLQKK